MSAEMVAGAAFMGLGLASTAIPIQAGANLMRQVGGMNRTVKSQRRVRQRARQRGRQRGLDLNAAIFGEKRQRKRRR